MDFTIQKRKIAANIRYFAAMEKLSLGEIAQEAKISKASLSSILNSNSDMKFGTLLNIANVLKVQPEDLLK